jgi:hypothetical protein
MVKSGPHSFISIAVSKCCSYGFTIIGSDDYKYIKMVFCLMLNDLNMHPQNNSWAKYIK